ncbi:MAG: zinc-ribbon domain-containing protein, partial [Chloroflexi bacterium]|nr:zinc-ribbon domain-containing protein [Chloroflexota bacterium]
MRCRACGAVVGTNARFCEQCGTRLKAPDASDGSAGTATGADPSTKSRVQ